MTNTPDPAQGARLNVEELKRLDAAATPRPWDCWDMDEFDYHVFGRAANYSEMEANAELTVYLRNHVPQIIAALSPTVEAGEVENSASYLFLVAARLQGDGHKEFPEALREAARFLRKQAAALARVTGENESVRKQWIDNAAELRRFAEDDAATARRAFEQEHACFEAMHNDRDSFKARATTAEAALKMARDRIADLERQLGHP